MRRTSRVSDVTMILGLACMLLTALGFYQFIWVAMIAWTISAWA